MISLIIVIIIYIAWSIYSIMDLFSYLKGWDSLSEFTIIWVALTIFIIGYSLSVNGLTYIDKL